VRQLANERENGSAKQLHLKSSKYKEKVDQK
jgi:hypothetical protein